MKRFMLTLTHGPDGTFVAGQESDEAALPRALEGLAVALVPGDRLTIECHEGEPG